MKMQGHSVAEPRVLESIKMSVSADESRLKPTPSTPQRDKPTSTPQRQPVKKDFIMFKSQVGVGGEASLVTSSPLSSPSRTPGPEKKNAIMFPRQVGAGVTATVPPVSHLVNKDVLMFPRQVGEGTSRGSTLPPQQPSSAGSSVPLPLVDLSQYPGLFDSVQRPSHDPDLSVSKESLNKTLTRPTSSHCFPTTGNTRGKVTMWSLL